MTEADFWEKVFIEIREYLRYSGPITKAEHQYMLDEITKYLKRHRRKNDFGVWL